MIETHNGQVCLSARPHVSYKNCYPISDWMLYCIWSRTFHSGQYWFNITSILYTYQINVSYLSKIKSINYQLHTTYITCYIKLQDNAILITHYEHRFVTNWNMKLDFYFIQAVCLMFHLFYIQLICKSWNLWLWLKCTQCLTNN